MDEETIRAAIDSVFAAPAFDRSVRRTLLGRFLAWLRELLRPAGDYASELDLKWVGVALVGVIVLLVLLRFAYVAWYERVGRAQGAQAAGGSARLIDPWRAAQELAARGEYTEAAHALYAAAVRALAKRNEVRAHPSKTAGDYARELRRRSSAAFQPFRDFARGYEAAIYGRGSCDRNTFEQLLPLASRLVTGRA